MTYTERARDRLNSDPLDLLERHLISPAVVKLGGARAFVRRHGLGLLKETAALDRGRQLAVCAISLARARIAAAAKCFIIRVTQPA